MTKIEIYLYQLLSVIVSIRRVKNRLMIRVCNKLRLTASDCQEGNRRDCSMSGNQTSGKEGGVQCVMTVVCMYICLISCISDSKEAQACRLVAGQVPVYILRPAI